MTCATSSHSVYTCACLPDCDCHPIPQSAVVTIESAIFSNDDGRYLYQAVR